MDEPLEGELPAGVLVDIQGCLAAERCISPSWRLSEHRILAKLLEFYDQSNDQSVTQSLRDVGSGGCTAAELARSADKSQRLHAFLPVAVTRPCQGTDPEVTRANYRQRTKFPAGQIL